MTRSKRVRASAAVRRGDRVGGLGLMAEPLERALERGADQPLVVDDQDLRLHDAASGSHSEKVMPGPGVFGCASMRPPCASAMFCEIARPSPWPSRLW